MGELNMSSVKAGTTLDFTYCVARWAPLQSFTFLVMTASKPEAQQRARAYAMDQRPKLGEPREIEMYPRNYLREARKLYAAGRHD